MPTDARVPAFKGSLWRGALKIRTPINTVLDRSRPWFLGPCLFFMMFWGRNCCMKRNLFRQLLEMEVPFRRNFFFGWIFCATRSCLEAAIEVFLSESSFFGGVSKQRLLSPRGLGFFFPSMFSEEVGLVL
ncbi:hypothetical protein CDAR_42191 [Caerostris darwini]|uniref:Uncharacterized protein n=1 Tax=Caerostris darwini TaxID=1538125 RepID=A0AAV4RM03_9ARAC|nr:hypothetical protein CDAR_42191 [Caerostris darwini]